MSFGALFIGLFFMLIGWIVSSRLKSKFREYSQIHLTRDLTGAEIARLMLADNGISDVQVVSVEGQLTDHYNPANKTVNLSQEVYHGRNAAAAAVAAHECGHAVQHARAYSMLEFRSAMVPIQNVSAQVINFLFMIMMFGSIFAQGILSWSTALLVIIGCYGVFTLFAFVTLPVEFDASKRALAWIEARGIVTRQEHNMAKDALKWAAMTYVVAAIGALTTLFYYVMMFLGSRDE
ncbi:zinc metallopeptidase [Fulvivirgaceae bacterium PWU4]|uniref:Zinc metallopeptidase n=1 Tax=Chryseosolibacter histidini TaxID=2782349 RepID=A0AAP2GLH3_9BACT|nr:zinc metallopeptidase [Chryseosolibacter histidini]MBT1700401.1 zinc metallopeptidase [Chryseosolibacter histidini]